MDTGDGDWLGGVKRVHKSERGEHVAHMVEAKKLKNQMNFAVNLPFNLHSLSACRKPRRTMAR